MGNPYSDSVVADEGRKAFESYVWKIARDLWDQFNDNGGFTFGRFDNVPQIGYLIGGVVPETITKTVTVQTIYNNLIVNWNELADDTVFFGAWFNPETQLTHFDLSTHVFMDVTARQLAHDRGEIAFYSLESGESEYVADRPNDLI